MGDEKKVLSDAVLRLQEEIKEVRDRSAQADSRAYRAISRVDGLREELSQGYGVHEEQLDVLAERIEAVGTTVHTQGKCIYDHTDRTNRLTDRVETLEDDDDVKRHQFNLLTDRVAALEILISGSDSSGIEDLGQRVEAFRSEVGAAEGALDQLTEANNRLVSRVAELEEQMKIRVGGANVLHGRIQDLVNRVVALEGKACACEGGGSLRDAMDSVIAELRKLEDEPVTSPHSDTVSEATWRYIRQELAREIVTRLRRRSATVISDWIEREYLPGEEDGGG